jgi:RNA polymerase II subunit A small phosphatase-like protein
MEDISDLYGLIDPSEKNNLHIVLDLDGMLISEFNCEEEADDALLGDYKRAARPYLETFLVTLFEKCAKVSLWTAASLDWYRIAYKKYLSNIMEKYNLQFDFVFDGSRCSRLTTREGLFAWSKTKYKPLRKIWKAARFSSYTRHNTLLIDNEARNAIQNYGNILIANTYHGDEPNDTELLRLLKWVDIIAEHYEKTKSIRHFHKKE